MTIVAGNDIVASDFILVTVGAADSGKVPKLNALGKVNLSVLNSGSNGSDSVLSISAGTTTLDLGGAKIFIKNYTSISITGTAKLTFTNAHAEGTLIILKYNAGITITSSNVPAVDGTGFGGTANNYGTTNCQRSGPGGGAGISAGGTAGEGQRYSKTVYDHIFIGCGAGGTSGTQTPFGGNNPGSPGGAASVSENGSAGTAGTSTSGNSASPTGGVGGIGGAGILFIGDGAINFTSTIWSKGTAGGNPNFNGGGSVGASAGSGGAGGSVGIIGDSITANTGTIVVTAGAAGTSGTNCGTPGASADGYSFVTTKAAMF